MPGQGSESPTRQESVSLNPPVSPPMEAGGVESVPVTAHICYPNHIPP